MFFFKNFRFSRQTGVFWWVFNTKTHNYDSFVMRYLNNGWKFQFLKLTNFGIFHTIVLSFFPLEILSFPARNPRDLLHEYWNTQKVNLKVQRTPLNVIICLMWSIWLRLMQFHVTVFYTRYFVGGCLLLSLVGSCYHFWSVPMWSH